MNKSFWSWFVVAMGITSILFITLFQNITNTDEHNSNLLKEVTKSAMEDAIDYGYYRKTGALKINAEKFEENFIRRFAESAGGGNAYHIYFMDINETPPKVSVKVTSNVRGNVTATLGDNDGDVDFNITDNIDAILETPNK